jgi:plasmid replication initiation protein
MSKGKKAVQTTAANNLAYEEERDQALAQAHMVAEHEERNPRCIQDIMAYPYFSLTKQKRTKALHFVNQTGDIEIKVEGIASYGIANIHDADILLWLSAEIRRHYERTGEVIYRVLFSPHKMLKQIGRGKGGAQIKRLPKALKRLSRTHIETTVRTEHQEKASDFSWLIGWHTSVNRQTGEPTKLWSATVHPWLVQGIIQDHNILTLNPDYYRLSSGLEKRLYQIARKHAGKQSFGFVISMETLHAKVGSGGVLKYFARDVRTIAHETGCLLEYRISVVPDGEEKVWFRHESFEITASEEQ